MVYRLKPPCGRRAVLCAYARAARQVDARRLPHREAATVQGRAVRPTVGHQPHLLALRRSVTDLRGARDCGPRDGPQAAGGGEGADAALRHGGGRAAAAQLREQAVRR
eukprot:4078504-Prymnesium_polylepis.1